MWDRWQKGDTLHEIARLFGRHHSSVRGILERTGGIHPPVRVSGNWRITFKFDGPDAIEVDYEDYH